METVWSQSLEEVPAHGVLRCPARGAMRIYTQSRDTVERGAFVVYFFLCFFFCQNIITHQA